MKFNISSFTHVGTKRELNQDRVLVNSEIIDSGFLHLEDQNECFCFVADGVGGSVRGEIASQFITEKISDLKQEYLKTDEDLIRKSITEINTDLIDYAFSNPEYFGTGSTLTGLIINREQNTMVIHAGDSELRALKNNMFFQITEDQVYDEAAEGSPLMSYFGGKEFSLDLSISSLRSLSSKDIYVLASDGLFGSLSAKQIKELISTEKTLREKTEQILDTALKQGADDNISCVLIEVL
jgi:serine/threonine protein phosphatase PrpC